MLIVVRLTHAWASSNMLRDVDTCLWPEYRPGEPEMLAVDDRGEVRAGQRAGRCGAEDRPRAPGLSVGDPAAGRGKRQDLPADGPFEHARRADVARFGDAVPVERGGDA